MKAVIYLRVSTVEQADARNGLLAQKDACRRCAQALGLEGGVVFSDEGISGATGLDKRPGLLQAIDFLGKGDILLVAKRDRLGRDPIEVAMIERAIARRGARTLSAAGEGTDGNGPSDVLMRRLIDAFGEYERLVIGARTSAALQARRARGLKNGGDCPYGYRSDDEGRLTEDPDEQYVIALVQKLRAAGLSFREIARELSSRGHATRKGTAWHPMTIKRLAEAA